MLVSLFLLAFNMDPLKGAAFATMVASNWNKGVQYIGLLQYSVSQMQTQSLLHGKTACHYSVIHLPLTMWYIVETLVFF